MHRWDVVKSAWRRIFPDALQRAPVWYEFPSGIGVRIDSVETLSILIELFAVQPYAAALDLSAPSRCVVDLGAHRGLFVLFACHHLRAKGGPDPQFVCVEADRRNLVHAGRQLSANGLDRNVRLVHGAVAGQRQGEVDFYVHPRFHGRGHIQAAPRWTTRVVPVVDLAREIPFDRIDLLKIDVEGAEQSVFQEYPDLLARTRVLVAEMHLQRIDHSLCRKILEGSGLRYQQCTFQWRDIRVEIYARESAGPHTGG